MLVEVEILGCVMTAQYGTLKQGDILRTNAEFAAHLVDDCGAAKYTQATDPGSDGEAVTATDPGSDGEAVTATEPVSAGAAVTGDGTGDALPELEPGLAAKTRKSK
jgi:hypothetical protein